MHPETPGRPTPEGRRPGRQRGTSLVEVLIGVLILSLGAAAMLQGQRQLWVALESAVLRAEATDQAADDLESLRVYTRVQPDPGDPDPGPSWTETMAPLSANITLAMDKPARMQRQVRATDLSLLMGATTTVQTATRDNHSVQTDLHTWVAGIDPRLGVVATLPRNREPPTALLVHSNGRAPVRLPTEAVRLDPRSLILKLHPDSPTAWVLQRDTGLVTARCPTPRGLSAAQVRTEHLSSCTAVSGLLIAGYVRFANSLEPQSFTSLQDPTAPALPLQVKVTLTSTGHPQPATECDDDSPDPTATTPSPQRTWVRYFCVIQPAGSPPSWSGRIDVVPVGWSIGASADTFRVCRYSADRNGNGRIDNEEHPAQYERVTGPLVDQNLLIVAGHSSCPALPPAPLTDEAGVLTQPHQP